MSTADLQSLQALLRTSPHGRGPTFGPILQRVSKDLSERQLRGSPDSADVFRAAAALFPRFSGDVHGQIRLAGLVDCVRYFYHIGDFRWALASSNALLALSQRLGQQDDVSLAKNMLGIALTEVGDVGKALLCYADSLEIAIELGNSARQASVLGNAGIALNTIGLYRNAVPCLKRAMAFGCTFSVQHACNLAQSQLELGDYGAALEAIDFSIRNRSEPAEALSAFSRCVAEFTYAQVALGIDDLALARRHSEACMRYGSASPRGKCLANIVLGQCEVRAGKEKAGLKTLLRTLDLSAGKFCHSLDCLAALVRAYDETGQPELALQYLTQLLEMLTQSRQRSAEGLVAWSMELESDAPIALVLHQSDLRARAAERRTEAVTVEMFERLAITAEIKEDDSGEHGRRVGVLSRLLAQQIGWKRTAAKELERAARLHDIGKVAIPDSVLRQSAPLQEQARALLRGHCEAGGQILGNSTVPSLRLAESIARCHHEAWDGTGYPRGLAGKQIPISARIVAIADAFDALTHDRSYSRALNFEDACVMLRTQAGSQFEPSLLHTFLALLQALEGRYGSVDSAISAETESSAISTARRKIAHAVAS